MFLVNLTFFLCWKGEYLKYFYIYLIGLEDIDSKATILGGTGADLK